MEELPHVTVTITEDFVERFEPCIIFESVRHLLPATISTDPEDNIELAVAILSTREIDEPSMCWCVECRISHHTMHVGWLLRVLGVEVGTFGYTELRDHLPREPWPVDAGIIAQQLAMLADLLDTRKDIVK